MAKQDKSLSEQQLKIRQIAAELMQLAMDTIVVNMRFLDIAVFALTPVPKENLLGASTDGKHLYYDPLWLLVMAKEESPFAIRLCLHCLFHCIFLHFYGYDSLEQPLWDLACDLACEDTIASLQIPASGLLKDPGLQSLIARLKRDMNPETEEIYHHSVLWNQMGMSRMEKKKKIPFTAEHIYHFLQEHRPSPAQMKEWSALAHMDEHVTWIQKTEIEPSLEAFRKIAQRVKADLKSFSKAKAGSGSLEVNLSEATRERYDYRQILARFSALSEDIAVNDDEFDYIYYTYGLSHYGNMPLVEPLEYREIRKIRDFVIVIDTSASCREGLIASFLKQTVEILQNSESFFNKVNIHILQCDNQVRKDTVITDLGALGDYASKVKMEGLGSTDFRPAFDYVQQLMDEKKLENMKGLIYFTDGYGIYPEKMPAFKTLFAFMNEDEHRPKLPVWAMSVVLE